MLSLVDGARDLRSGVTPWEARSPPSREQASAPPKFLSADIVIVGAGITGAFLAERLTRAGRSVVLLDRRGPERGSTAASTSLIQWEIDVPMIELEERLGFQRAARTYARTVGAVREIARLVAFHRIGCDFRPRHSLYIAGSHLDPAALREERRLRALAGIEGQFWDTGDLAAAGFNAEAALRYRGSAEADPVALARGLIAAALARGATLLAPVTAMAYDHDRQGIAVVTDRGTVVRGSFLVLATGYEMPSFVPAKIHRVVSTWAMATAPSANWPSTDLLWEASNPYLYARTTVDGRVIAGGEDAPITDASTREAMTDEKIERISRKLGTLCASGGPGLPEFAWSGFFGQTEDGLPLIGRVPGQRSTLAAYGYGGNGITFSAIAADMIATLIANGRDRDEATFALDRDG